MTCIPELKLAASARQGRPHTAYRRRENRDKHQSTSAQYTYNHEHTEEQSIFAAAGVKIAKSIGSRAIRLNVRWIRWQGCVVHRDL
jgi:hypothetical protein